MNQALFARRLAVSITAGALLLAYVASAAAQTTVAPAGRGELLYATHCAACHTVQMHWRDQKLAVDWRTLRAQVRRWQGVAQLGWTEADVDEVARYLNAAIYRYREPARVGRTPVPAALAAATPPAGQR
jgi:mono/diheme cytochrome c family protein